MNSISALELFEISSFAEAAATKESGYQLTHWLGKFNKTFCKKARRAAKKGVFEVTLYVHNLDYGKELMLKRYYMDKGFRVTADCLNLPVTKWEGRKLMYPVVISWKDADI